jgi:hypothetical protein
MKMRITPGKTRFKKCVKYRLLRGFTTNPNLALWPREAHPRRQVFAALVFSNNNQILRRNLPGGSPVLKALSPKLFHNGAQRANFSTPPGRKE